LKATRQQLFYRKAKLTGVLQAESMAARKTKHNKQGMEHIYRGPITGGHHITAFSPGCALTPQHQAYQVYHIPDREGERKQAGIIDNVSGDS